MRAVRWLIGTVSLLGVLVLLVMLTGFGRRQGCIIDTPEIRCPEPDLFESFGMALPMVGPVAFVLLGGGLVVLVVAWIRGVVHSISRDDVGNADR